MSCIHEYSKWEASGMVLCSGISLINPCFHKLFLLALSFYLKPSPIPPTAQQQSHRINGHLSLRTRRNGFRMNLEGNLDTLNRKFNDGNIL